MQDASPSSPLALPENAWGRRRWYGPGVSPGTGRTLLAVILSFYGCFWMLVGLWNGDVFSEARSREAGLGLFHFRHMVVWIDVAEGLIWIGLGTAVWRRFPSMARGSIALLMLMKGARHVVWLISPNMFSRPWCADLIVGLTWLALGFGIWRASEWARSGCTVLGLAIYGFQVFGLAWSTRQLGDWVSSHPIVFAQTAILAATVVALPPLTLAIYGVLRSTRDHFAEARDARDRRSGVPEP